MSAATHPMTLIDPVCGRPWAHASHVPKLTDLITHEGWEHLDGRPMQRLDIIECESCGRRPDTGGAMAFAADPANYRPREGAAP